VERFAWTEHAEMRVRQRGLNREEIERMIEQRHGERAINRGRAQWRIIGPRVLGVSLVVIYDHPHDSDTGAVRIVSAWPL
jgi:hypothetical protein